MSPPACALRPPTARVFLEEPPLPARHTPSLGPPSPVRPHPSSSRHRRSRGRAAHPSTCARRRPPRWPGVTDADAAPLLGTCKNRAAWFRAGRVCVAEHEQMEIQASGEARDANPARGGIGEPCAGGDSGGAAEPPGRARGWLRGRPHGPPSVSQAQGRAPRSVRK